MAKIGTASAVCRIDVEKLRIVPVTNKLDLYNHFYEDLEYSVYPPHAASLGVKISSSSCSNSFCSLKVRFLLGFFSVGSNAFCFSIVPSTCLSAKAPSP